MAELLTFDWVSYIAGHPVDTTNNDKMSIKSTYYLFADEF